MRWLRPKSLSGLMLLGLALLALPLLVAIVTAALQFRALSSRGQRIVLQGVTAARESQKLFSEIDALDRTSRLYDVLDDSKLLQVYRHQDEALSATRRLLYRQAGTPTRQTLGKLAAKQRQVRHLVLTTPPGIALTETAAFTRRFATLGTLVDRIARQSNQQIDTEVASLKALTDRARELLFWQAALLIPLTVVAISLLTLLVGRPLRQIDQAIRALGHGSLHQSIAVSGPHDLERLGTQIEWLRLRLIELNEERDRFLRHMSHELKTPLANIREGTELLMDGAVGKLDSSQREVTAILRDNGIQLQRMIENLLSFSAWQTSTVGLDASEFRLRPLVRQVLESQQLTVLSQRMRLDVQVQDVTLVADRGKVRLILENLVSNAVKYSPKGGTIHIRACTFGEHLVLDVADTGPGIPKDEREQVFRAFYTGRAANGISIKGTGIGLSVVLEFVTAHGGTVQIVDGEFPGAHFRIRMPISIIRDRPPKEESQAHAA
jgi:two-component system sensor histidine kinase GlrK